jgi:hypothetical protein
VRAHTGQLLLVTLLAAAADGAKAQSIEAGAAPAVPQASEPSLSLRKAQLVGAAAGLALGAGLGRRAEASVPALRPLRGADAIVTGSAMALYLGAGILGRKRSEAASAAHAAVPMGEVNGFDQKMRKLAVGRRSLEKRLLLDHLSSSTVMVSFFQPVGMVVAADVPHKWSRDVPVLRKRQPSRSQ